MTTALTAASTEFDFSPRSIDDAQSLAKELAKSILVPKDFKGKPADVFAAITYGHELGLKPWAAMQSLIVIHGRVTMYADAMVALILNSGKCEYFRCSEMSATSVTYETLRIGSTPSSYTFTAEDAKRAGLTSDMYRKFPQRMLGHRAKSYLARDIFPDVLLGLQSYEEIIDIEPAAVDVAQYSAPEELPAEVVEVEETEDLGQAPNDQASPADMITDAKTVAELEALGVLLGKLRGEERAAAHEIYTAHMTTLKGAQ